MYRLGLCALLIMAAACSERSATGHAGILITEVVPDNRTVSLDPENDPLYQIRPDQGTDHPPQSADQIYPRRSARPRR